MEKERLSRLEAKIKEIASNMILTDDSLIEDFGVININKIKVSSDLSYSDIYVSSIFMGEDLTKSLAPKAHIIQKKLGELLQIRKIPKIRFRYDDSPEISQDINGLINSLDIKG